MLAPEPAFGGTRIGSFWSRFPPERRYSEVRFLVSGGCDRPGADRLRDRGSPRDAKVQVVSPGALMPRFSRTSSARSSPRSSVQPEPEGLRQRWTRGAGETVLLRLSAGLAREFMLPLASFRSLDPDPLLPLFGALSELGPGEAGLVQVLFERVREEWAESVMRAVHDSRGEPFFADCPRSRRLRGRRSPARSSPLCLRVAAKSGDCSGAWRIVRDLAGALTRLRQPGRERASAARPRARAGRLWRRSSRVPPTGRHAPRSDELAAFIQLRRRYGPIPELWRDSGARRARRPHSSGLDTSSARTCSRPERGRSGAPVSLKRSRSTCTCRRLGHRQVHAPPRMILEDIEAGHGVGASIRTAISWTRLAGRIPEDRPR